MAANPPLAVMTLPNGESKQLPHLYLHEYLMLERKGIVFDIEGVRTPNGKWNATGNLFLSNFRMVFLANKQDKSGR